MVDLVKKIKNLFFEKARPLEPGFFTYHTPNDSDFPYRMHLRIESDGTGVLVINASTVLHLNSTATEFAFHLVNQTPKNDALESIITRYQITYSEAREDFESFINRIEKIVSTPDLDPVTYLDFDRETPFSHDLSAPYRLDCALTYKLHENSDQLLAPTDRVKRELSTDEWKVIIKKAWDSGIPHIIFTGGEPTLRSDLIELSKYSDELGQVTGIISDGLRFQDTDFLNDLLNAGIDHILITMDLQSEIAWDSFKNVIDKDVHVTVHITVTNENHVNLISSIKKLVNLGLQNISLSTSNLNLEPEVREIRNKCAELGLNLVWNMPVPYSQFNPISLEVDREDDIIQGAGIGWLYIEPDGDVLPAQGINQVSGNFLENSWDEIWAKVKQLKSK